MTPRDRIHLAALRGALALTEHRAVKGKRRDLDCACFMLGALAVESLNTPVNLVDLASSGDFLIAVNRVVAFGFRELRTQLHILELAEREERTSGKTAEEI